MRSRRSSIACSPRRPTASAGRGTGSTSSATPTTTTATRRPARPVASRSRPGATATGSSTRSTATCRSTSSSSTRSPATCCPTPDGKELYADGLIATDVPRRTASWDRGDADKEKMVSDMVDDQIDTVGKAFLGLTLGCARCHDHKFDPISQADYYGLAGIFYSTHILKDLGTKGGEYHAAAASRSCRKAYVAKRGRSSCGGSTRCNAKLAELDKKTPKPPPTIRSAAELDRRARPAAERTCCPSRRWRWRCRKAARRADCSRRFRTCRSTSAAATPGSARSCRGACRASSPATKQPKIARGQRPARAGPLGRVEGQPAHGARDRQPRLAVAFRRRGWSRTPNNFGMLSRTAVAPGAARLAGRAVRRGRLVAQEAAPPHHAVGDLPAVERRDRATRLARDPENRWLGRFAPRRLEAEAIRDAMLVVAGRLDLTPGGPADATTSSTAAALALRADGPAGTAAASRRSSTPPTPTRPPRSATSAPSPRRRCSC